MATKTGPNPSYHRTARSKHHLLIDAEGSTVNTILIKANRDDLMQFLPIACPEGSLPSLTRSL